MAGGVTTTEDEEITMSMKSFARRNILVSVILGAIHVPVMAATICSGAEIYSKQSVKYGRWETRMKMAGTPGSVSSFFTYYNNSSNAGEQWREIDLELLGKKPKGFQSNIILQSGDHSNEDFHTLTADLSSEFHTYTLDWTPDSVVWRVDGNRLRSETDRQVVTALQGQSQSFRMNLWSSTSVSWVGTLDLSKLPIYQVVNWMRYSTYTPGAGPNKSNFTESWVDDFTSFNSTRWSKGDWTFDGNQAQFTATNLSNREGYLVLALTRPDQEGIKQTFPKDPAGDTYSTTSVSGATRELSLRATGSTKGIRIEGAQPGLEIAVRDAHGRILTRANGSVSEIPLEARGVLFVQAGSQSIAVVR
jgi:hypothetical protein